MKAFKASSWLPAAAIVTNINDMNSFTVTIIFLNLQSIDKITKIELKNIKICFYQQQDRIALG